MRVLVAYASRYGATRGIAERIAATLSSEGLGAHTCAVELAGDPVDYDAAVIGSAAYFFHWMAAAKNFIRRNRDTLAKRPVWLFSSGPLGMKKLDPTGRDMCEICEPKEIAGFRRDIHPRDHRVLFGAMTAANLGIFHRFIHWLPIDKSNELLPEGDFRDWAAIDAWANGIAAELHRTPSTRYETPTLKP